MAQDLGGAGRVVEPCRRRPPTTRSPLRSPRPRDTPACLSRGNASRLGRRRPQLPGIRPTIRGTGRSGTGPDLRSGRPNPCPRSRAPAGTPSTLPWRRLAQTTRRRVCGTMPTGRCRSPPTRLLPPPRNGTVTSPAPDFPAIMPCDPPFPRFDSRVSKSRARFRNAQAACTALSSASRLSPVGSSTSVGSPPATVSPYCGANSPLVYAPRIRSRASRCPVVCLHGLLCFWPFFVTKRASTPDSPPRTRGLRRHPGVTGLDRRFHQPRRALEEHLAQRRAVEVLRTKRPGKHVRRAPVLLCRSGCFSRYVSQLRLESLLPEAPRVAYVFPPRRRPADIPDEPRQSERKVDAGDPGSRPPQRRLERRESRPGARRQHMQDVGLQCQWRLKNSHISGN